MSVVVITGPMYSGKTTELTRLINRKKIAKKRCVIVKHSRDTRYDVEGESGITTHMGQTYNDVEIITVSELTETLMFTLIENYEVVGIDEGFMFGDSIKEFSCDLANNGIEVIVSSIDSSYKQEPFSSIVSLIALSENHIKLSAVCKDCSKDAHFTVRLVTPGTNSIAEEAVIVGNNYKAVCRSCMIRYWYNIKNK